jgi:hypothetical protein
MNTNMKNVKYRYPFYYSGNIILLAICCIIWLPFGLLLFMKNVRMTKEDNIIYYIDYKGSFGWLVFWSFIFFPIAIFLLLINGADVVKDQNI